MPIGPGKYGANAEALIQQFGTKMCLVIMVGDTPQSASFDCATADPSLLLSLPEILRNTADELEKNFRQGRL
jgi:hypothetical protein